MALKLDVLANTRQFVSEMQKAGSSTEDISDALDELVRQGDITGDRLQKSFKDVERSSDKTSKAIKTDAKTGFKAAEQASENFKDEAAGTAREVAASFDGSAESISGGFQELAANALSSFGLIGAAAGGIIAGAIGLVTTALTANDAAITATKEHFADLYKSAGEEGRAFLSEAEIQSGIWEQLYDPTDGFKKRKKLEEDAATIGVSMVQLAEARAGGEDAVNFAIERGEEHVKALHEAWRGLPGTMDSAELAAQQVVDQLKSQQDVQKQNEQINKEVTDANVRDQKRVQDEIGKTAAMLRNPFTAVVDVRLQDNTAADLRRIKGNIEAGFVQLNVRAKRQYLE